VGAENRNDAATRRRWVICGPPWNRPAAVCGDRPSGARRAVLWLLVLAFGVSIYGSLAAGPASASSPGIAIYFTENIPAMGAVARMPLIEDALISLLDSADVSIDACLFSLTRGSVRDALVRAHRRGVRVRVACDLDHQAEFRFIEDEGMPVMYGNRSGLMHNKFFVVDRRTVWTGSTNMTDEGFSSNHNNSPSIICPELALAYEMEFEEMFVEGNFGGTKVDNTPHVISCGSAEIESYFSPSDGSQAELIDEIKDANASIYFAVYYFTADAVREALVEQAADGVVVKGIYDAAGAGHPYAEYEALCSAGIPVKVENLNGRLHHKFMIIDVDGEDPVVVTGSYNWTAAANEKNDENTLVIHDRAIAETYYAEWKHTWSAVPPACGCNMPTVVLPLVIRSCTWNQETVH